MARVFRHLIIIGIVVLSTTSVFGHCDAVNGPVVSDARMAIESGDVEPVLKWIAPDDEGTIRTAFDRTIAAREASEEAQELADQWFFETVVRIHRASEGAPYTGLRPASYDPGVALRLGDESLVSGEVGELEALIIENVRHGIRERFERASEAFRSRSTNVEAGREFVEAYVEYMHYAERLHRDATTNAVDGEEDLPVSAHDH